MKQNQEGSGDKTVRPFFPDGCWVLCQSKMEEKFAALEQLPIGKEVRPDPSSKPCMGVPELRGSSGAEARPRGGLAEDRSPGLIVEPRDDQGSLGQTGWGLQSLILRGPDLCSTLDEISGLGSTVRDLHAHPGHTTFLPLHCHLPLPLAA